jgi:hypothetical protein
MGRRDIAQYLFEHVEGLSAARTRGKIATALVLRDWLMARLNYAGRDQLLEHTGADPFQFLKDLQEFRGGVWCGGAAWLYAELAGALDIPAMVYLYGYKDGLSHATTLIGTHMGKSDPVWRFFNIDAYLGYVFRDRTGGKLLSIGEMWRRIMADDMGGIVRRDMRITRCLVIPKSQRPDFYAWLFDEGVPQSPRGKGRFRQLAAWPGAVHTYDKLLLPTTPYRKLADQQRGKQSLAEFMLSLMMICPRLVPARTMPDFGAYEQLYSRLLMLLSEGYQTMRQWRLEAVKGANRGI